MKKLDEIENQIRRCDQKVKEAIHKADREFTNLYSENEQAEKLRADFIFEKTKVERKELDNLKIKKKMVLSGFSERQMNHTFENYQEKEFNKALIVKAKIYADNFFEYLPKGKGLMMTGSVGTGKTHLMTAIIRRIIEGEGMYLRIKIGSFMKLLYEIKSNFREENEIIEKFSKYDILFLDDLGKEMITEWSKQILYLLVNERYENYKPTFITTNCNSKELSEKLDEATVSRFYETCVPFKFGKNDDFRKALSSDETKMVN